MSTPTLLNPWLWIWSVRPAARLRLFCLPFAGGSATAYRDWPEHLPEHVEVVSVQLPGRESRIREPPLSSIEELIPALAAGMADRLDRPYALFGHSLGALLAFELDRWQRDHDGPPPVRLLLSGRRAAHLPIRDTPITQLDDAAFLDAVVQLGGTPGQVRLDSDLAAVVLPMLRADFAVSEHYDPERARPTPTPVDTFAGLDDPWVPVADVQAWSQLTTGDFTGHTLPGDHFFVRTAQARVLRLVAAALAAGPGLKRAAAPVTATLADVVRPFLDTDVVAAANRTAFGHGPGPAAPLLLPRSLIEQAAALLAGALVGAVADPLDHPDGLAPALAGETGRPLVGRSESTNPTVLATCVDVEDPVALALVAAACHGLPTGGRAALVCTGPLPGGNQVTRPGVRVTGTHPVAAYRDCVTAFAAQVTAGRAALHQALGVARADALVTDLLAALRTDLHRPRTLVLAERT